jgi:peptidoglycan/xylan/chitin deacetylase (PgdA/CDA1 family)
VNSRLASATLIAAGCAGAAAVAFHAVPALAGIGPLRRRFLPGLAGSSSAPHIALTFDDGPHRQATPAVLKILDQHAITATFFLIGQMVQRNPGLCREIAAAGHEIAVHGYEHRLLLNRGWRATADDITRATNLIATHADTWPRWYRPPYGVATTSALHTAHRLRLKAVLWTDWGRDWSAQATPSTVLRTATRRLRPGATILLHDCDEYAFPGSWKNTVGALPALIDHAHSRGWPLGPLREHHLAR